VYIQITRKLPAEGSSFQTSDGAVFLDEAMTFVGSPPPFHRVCWNKKDSQ